MIFVALKLIFLAGFLYLALKAYQAQQMKLYYERQGVKFAGPFSVITDVFRVIMQAASNRYEIPIVPAIKKALNVDHLPSHAGLCMMGEVMLFFNDPEAL